MGLSQCVCQKVTLCKGAARYRWHEILVQEQFQRLPNALPWLKEAAAAPLSCAFQGDAGLRRWAGSNHPGEVR